MGAAKTALLVLIVLCYGVLAGGVVLSNLPVEALLDDPPLVELAVATVGAIGALGLVETVAP